MTEVSDGSSFGFDDGQSRGPADAQPVEPDALPAGSQAADSPSDDATASEVVSGTDLGEGSAAESAETDSPVTEPAEVSAEPVESIEASDDESQPVVATEAAPSDEAAASDEDVAPEPFVPVPFDDADRVRLLDAVDIAREALTAEGQQPGPHRQAIVEGDWAAAHYFDADLPGYRGWLWCVVVAGAPDTADITVSEVVLLPGDGSLLAPAWVPWAQRISADDLGPGDLLAAEADDTRLVPNQTDTGDEFRFDPDSPDADDIGQVDAEIGLGRRRLLSLDGRVDAAQRWYDGEYGPSAEMAQASPFPCCTCGFYIPLSGALRAAFGACTNEFGADGHVVSAEYGCGAHSDVEPPKGDGSPAYDAYDDGAIEIVAVGDPQPAGRS